MLKKILSEDKIFLPLVIFLIFVPHFLNNVGVRPDSPWTDYIGLPNVFSGDEPHYMVLLNSILKDGDLDVKNNYDNVHNGGFDAGRRFANSPLDHHVFHYINGKGYDWLYMVNFYRNPQTRKIFYKYKPGFPEDIAEWPEYSFHPPGMAFMLAPFAFPFRNSKYLESVCIILSGIVTVLALLCMRFLLGAFTQEKWIINLVSALTVLGTPIWHYGRSLFTEPYCVFFIIAAYAFALRRRDNFWLGAILPGLFIGGAMVLKPPYLLLMAPITILFLWEKDWFKAAGTLIFPFLAGCLFLYFNYLLRGDPFSSYGQPAVRTPLIGAWHLLTHLRRGILPYAPIALFAFWGWWKILKGDHKKEGWVTISGFAIWFVVLSILSGNWDNDTGYQYGCRHIVPVLTLLMVGLVTVVGKVPTKRKKAIQLSRAVLAVALLSIFINALGAIPYWKYWSRHPVITLLGGKS